VSTLIIVKETIRLRQAQTEPEVVLYLQPGLRSPHFIDIIEAVGPLVEEPSLPGAVLSIATRRPSMKVPLIAAAGVCVAAAVLSCALPRLPPTSDASPSPSAAPTATTPRLSDVNLENLIILEGDLAADCVASVAASAPDGDVPDLETAANAIYYEIQCVGDTRGGHVAVYLFDEPSQSRAAYEALHEEMAQPEDTPGVGDEAATSSLTIRLIREPITIIGGEVMFRRCRSVVVVRMWSTRSDVPILEYAQALDTRVAEVSCP
jgi:hypothetical protein